MNVTVNLAKIYVNVLFFPNAPEPCLLAQLECQILSIIKFLLSTTSSYTPSLYRLLRKLNWKECHCIDFCINLTKPSLRDIANRALSCMVHRINIVAILKEGYCKRIYQQCKKSFSITSYLFYKNWSNLFFVLNIKLLILILRFCVQFIQDLPNDVMILSFPCLLI